MFRASLILLVCLMAAFVYSHEQKTTIEVKERREQGPWGDQKTQSGTIRHDFIGGKDWGAGGYVTHERTNYNGHDFKNTHGGLQVNAKF